MKQPAKLDLHIVAGRLHKTVPELLSSIGGVEELADWLAFVRLEKGGLPPDEPEPKPDEKQWTAADIQLYLDMEVAKSSREGSRQNGKTTDSTAGH